MIETGDLESLLAAAIEAQRTGHFDTAEELASKALALDRNCLRAKLILGFLFARKSESAKAIPLLNEVLAAEPDSFEAMISLSALHLENGRPNDAVTLAKRAAEVRPNDPHVLAHLGKCLLDARFYAQALEPLQAAISLQPAMAEAYLVLGQAYELLGKEREALEALAESVRLSPSFSGLFAYGRALLGQRDYEKSAKCARACVRMEPNSAAAHLLLCGALIELQKPDEARSELEHAIRLDEDRKEALQTAMRQRQLGMLEDANDNLRQAIAIDPGRIWAYKSIMHNQRVSEKDRPLVDQMQAFLKDPSISETEVASLHYGVGKALEDLGDYEEAMHHYDEANRVARLIKLGNAPFDRRQYIAIMARLMNVPPCFDSSDTVLPVLVVGMMRSGTTLTEQILSSHQKVKGGGELSFWSQNAVRAVGGELGKVGREYLEKLKKIDPTAQRVTDKMPSNYRFAGLIHAALPNAHIIHIRRSPVDTCLSIWATPNHLPSEGGHTKEDIVFVYRQYLRMMEHWRLVLPADRFLEVDYEELVATPEPITRQMVEFCGLDWDEACLSPEHNMRSISTPSLWQARQPVYKSSVERWRKFEPWLGDFRELVDLEHSRVKGKG